MTIGQQVVGNWYVINEIAPSVFWIKEPGLVSFYLFRNQTKGLFVDSGLGLSEKAFSELLHYFGIKQYDVICTHAHADHIGLNKSAENCRLSKTEWDKYLLQNEKKQLDYFLEQLELDKLKPSILNEDDNIVIGNRSWQPNGFLRNGDIYYFHDWEFEVHETPGHTSGSLTFHERSLNFVFVGDLIYNGTMYLHLKDSNNEQFSLSLDRLITVVENNPGIKIWPAHNGIPLQTQHIFDTKLALDLINQGQIASVQSIPKSHIFEKGELFLHGSVKLIMKSI